MFQIALERITHKKTILQTLIFRKFDSCEKHNNELSL